MRRRPDPRLLRQDQTAPPQPRRRRQANHALWRIVITRMSYHPPTRAYVERRTAEGLSKTEIIRCLKRYVAPAQSTPTSAAPLTNPDSGGGLTLESAAAPRCWPFLDYSRPPPGHT